MFFHFAQRSQRELRQQTNLQQHFILEVCHFDDRFSVDLVCLYKFTLNYAEILFDCFNANFKTQV